jgi:hypothetical protein
MKKCSGPCQESKAESFFSKRQWKEDIHTRKCLACTSKKKQTNHWMCKHCKERKHKDEFSIWRDGRETVSNKATAWCNVCKRQGHKEETAMQSANVQSVTKSTKGG